MNELIEALYSLCSHATQDLEAWGGYIQESSSGPYKGNPFEIEPKTKEAIANLMHAIEKEYK